MPVNVRLVPSPKGCTRRNSSYHLEPHGVFPDVPVAQFPFVNGEIMEMRGWLEGFGGDAVNGHLEVVLHEGLFSLSGELEVYHGYTQHNLVLILGMLEGRAIGLAHRFPKSRFRLKITYKTEWVEGDQAGVEVADDPEMN